MQQLKPNQLAQPPSPQAKALGRVAKESPYQEGEGIAAEATAIADPHDQKVQPDRPLNEKTHRGQDINRIPQLHPLRDAIDPQAVLQ